ncbi:MAG TPA: hypothetical protein VMT16_08385 [Thermoanaerobaculia bacterium]|nr:hypothetical protein [Thermoanaerobaculia bacterium]
MVTPQQPVEPKKKGLHPLAWVAIGCAALVVIGGIVTVVATMFVGSKVKGFVERAEKNPELVAVEMMAAANPEVEIVASDEDARTVTLRNTATGEVTTLDFADVREGRIRWSGEGEEEAELSMGGEEGVFEVRSKEGTFRLGAGGEIPAWVPAYPGGTTESGFRSEDAQQVAGTFMIETGDPLDQAFEFYNRQLAAQGYELSETQFSSPQGRGAMLNGSQEGRQLNLTFSEEDGRTKIAVGYSLQKQ